VTGNALWEELAEAGVCAGRSSQSLKEQYRKQFAKTISQAQYLLPEEKALFKKYR
jgi:hypothetical protein